jgi:hypothetical protein
VIRDARLAERGGALDAPMIRARGKSKRPKTSEDELDEALALTFPASDAVAPVQPITHVGSATTRE